MDLADRQILGWSFSEGMQADQNGYSGLDADLPKAGY